MAKSNMRVAWGPVLALGIGVLAYGIFEWRGGGGGGASRDPVAGVPAVQGVRETLGNYEALDGWRLLDHRNNDGDSFVLLSDGGQEELTLRIYFVDAPEKRRNDYNGKRIGHQARYFGVSPGRAVEVGLAAKDFTLELLEREPFTVYTLWEEVYDSGRYFGFVRFADGDYLCERLVRAGLARIYTKGEDLPDGRRMGDFKSHLHGLESEAKAAGRGGWTR
ncbi:hypothetical protein BH23VER1_BH23VER1_12290 [soil metagenome]